MRGCGTLDAPHHVRRWLTVQQLGTPKFGVFFGGVIAASCLRDQYPEDGLRARSLHVIGDKDVVKRVSQHALSCAALRCRSRGRSNS